MQVSSLVKVAGKVHVDSGGIWIDDGSAVPGTQLDANGNPVPVPAWCKLATTFLGQTPADGTFAAITGYSQTDASGTPVIVPAADTGLQTLTP